MIKESPTTQATIAENPADRNWLQKEGWKALQFPPTAEINEIKRRVEFYVKGCLAMYNALKNTNFRVTRVEFDQRGTSPSLVYEARAFLTPFVTEIPEQGPEDVGSHLIPQEPDPPGSLV